jgi:hypothetical protein
LWLFSYAENGGVEEQRDKRKDCEWWLRSAVQISRDHPGLKSAGKITLFVSGLQDPAILHHDAQPAGKMQPLQEFFHGCGEEFGLLDLAAKFREGYIFDRWFCVLHAHDLSQDPRTGRHLYCGGGNQKSQ